MKQLTLGVGGSVLTVGIGQQFKTLSPPPRANSLTVPKTHMK